MAIEKLAGGGSWGIAFLVSAGIVAEIIAKACSSPQTLEINAKSRAPTLMKWVHLGVGEAAVFVTIAALADRRYASAFIAGGVLEAAITYAEYLHGRSAGLNSLEPGTEH